MTTAGPFTARVFLLLVSVVHFTWYLFEEALEMKQQKKPLPGEVSGIYDSGRYSSFISHEGEIRKLCFIYRAASFIIDTCILFSPVFAAIERYSGGSVYIAFALTYLVYWIAGELIDIPYGYYYNFVIEEKYGLNKRTRREFIKDELLSIIEGMVSGLAPLFLIAFCGEHMSGWTNGFTLGWKKTVLIGLGVCAALILVVLGVSLFQYFLMKKRYTFTQLPEGELREKITDLLVGCKKKVSEIYVYDESKKQQRRTPSF